MSDSTTYLGALLSILLTAPSAGSEGKNAALATGGDGPNSAAMYTIAQLPDNTLYEPLENQSKGNKPLPVLVWGNGGCADIGSSAKNILLEVASHGFFVIALGMPGEWPPPKGAGAMRTTAASQMIDAINWVTAENVKLGSSYYQRLDTNRIAVAGHSCGGLQALQAAADSRVATSVILDSGVLLDPPPFPMPGVKTNDKSELQDIHGPVLYLIGGPTDIAYKNALDDYERITRVPVFTGNTNVGHGGTFAEPNGGSYGRVMTAWLQWRLKDDVKAAQMFVGARCGLCVDTAWTVQRKGADFEPAMVPSGSKTP
jgi:dienelactone hydrolase